MAEVDTMSVLYLMRHGDAVSADINPERPLSDTGRSIVQQVVATWLQQHGEPAVDEIYHSSKLRARQTAELLAEQLSQPVPLRQVPHLEPGDPVELMSTTLTVDIRNLILVGHLPHLGKLASTLITGYEDNNGYLFRTGTVVCLDRIDDSQQHGTQWTKQWMLNPDTTV